MINFDALFPDEREKGETPLRQCQLVMLRMLKIMDYLYTKYNIKYFLTGGSLLGAIRHKGFIPIGWQTYLKRMYGDYMKLPPVEKRNSLHSAVLPNPFTPCEHTEILHWKNRTVTVVDQPLK